MSFESSIALRYLAASRRRAHVALITTISILGLAVGVAALVISLSLLSGFQDRIRSQMAQRSPHLRVSPARGAVVPDPARVAQALSSLAGIISVDPAIEGRGWASGRGVESTLPIRYRNAPAGELPASPDDAPPPARVSASVATRTRTGPGDLLTVTSSRTRLSPLGLIPVRVVVRVADVRRAGALEKAPDVELPEATARLLSGITSGARAYEARLANPSRAEIAARAVSLVLGPQYRVETWRELNAPLSFALRLEKAVIFATVALVIVVAALTIVSNIALTVVEKKRDLGVLTSLGATPGSLARIYLTLGALIGAIGTGLGIAIGVTAAILLDRYEVVSLPADVYLLTHVPFAVHAGEVALVGAFALLTAIAAAVLPARAAARLAAGEAIRLSR
jgi:lipoprotein-releasing system permease protein